VAVCLLWATYADAVEERPDAGGVGVCVACGSCLTDDIRREERERQSRIRAALQEISDSRHTFPGHNDICGYVRSREQAQRGGWVGGIGAVKATLESTATLVKEATISTVKGPVTAPS